MTPPIAMHERIAYSAMPERAPVQWPNGARLALWVAPNIEHYEYLPQEVRVRDPWPRVPHPDSQTGPRLPHTPLWGSATNSDSLPLWGRVGVGAREAPPVRHACPSPQPSPQRGEGASTACTDSHLTP